MLFFLIFPETVRAEEEDQVGPQAQESFHDSSTDSCLAFPYSSDSPRPFPPSLVHSVTDSPERVSPLPIATSNPSRDNSAIHSPIVHNFPTPVLSTLPISIPSQTFTSVLFTPTTDSYNTPPYIPFSSSSLPQTGPIVFPGSPPDFPFFRTTLSGSDSTFPNTVSLPSYPLPSMVTPTTIPIPFFSTESQSTSGLDLSRVEVEVPGVPILGEGELPGAEEAKSPPPPVVRPLPSPAIFGLIINQVQSPLEVLLLMMP